MPFDLMKTSLIGLPFLFGIVAATVGVAVLACWPRRRRWRRALLAATAVMLSLCSTAAWINAYFAYMPSVGAVFGQRARDQVSPTELHHRMQLIATAAVAPPPVTRGVVERVAIPATASGFRARVAQVYLPPVWFSTPRPQLPVIELLHGTPGAPEDWTRAGMADVAADRWASVHHGVAPVIVMPDPNGSFTADTECVDRPQARADTYLSVDVPNWAVANLGVSAHRSSWAIVGSSEGGYCALELALRHPERYATFADLSGLDRPTWPGGALRQFGGSWKAYEDHLPALQLAAHPPRVPMAGWFTAGTADGAVTRSVRAMAAAARTAGIDTVLRLQPNAHHTWRVWRHAFIDLFPWLAAHLGGAAPVEGAVS
jgi:S-formylglutathione hydrolase FrmB